MKSKIILGIAITSILISGCSTMKTSDRCLTYTTSGATGEEWAPTKYYQSESMLFMQLPAYVQYTPTIEVMDKEFDQPYKIAFKFNPGTHQLEVEDNHDEYILTRKSYDELEDIDRIYIRCNRKATLN